MSARPLEFRDPGKARALRQRLAEVVDQIGRPVALMHVCGSHEQAIARYGLRAALPRALDLIMGPGCPVCVTDLHEVDEAVALVRQGCTVLTYGDMLRVPGTRLSLADARAEVGSPRGAGARPGAGAVGIVYSADQAVQIARAEPQQQVVLYATGFETTAVATAAVLKAGPPANFTVLSSHKYVPPAMALVAGIPDKRVEGFLAAGHAATITGWGIFEPFAQQHDLPVVVAGFEPLDILAGLLALVEMLREGERTGRRGGVQNAYPRCVTREGNTVAQRFLWEVFAPVAGSWRGIGTVPEGNLALRPEWAAFDARVRFGVRRDDGTVAIDISREQAEDAPKARALCICGQVMLGMATPADCALFAAGCTPDRPVGACMVSTEGTCRIWHQYGGHPDP